MRRKLQAAATESVDDPLHGRLIITGRELRQLLPEAGERAHRKIVRLLGVRAPGGRKYVISVERLRAWLSSGAVVR